MNIEIVTRLNVYIDADDKRDLWEECYEAVDFLLKRGISIDDANYTVKNIVRAVRSNYGD